MYDTGLKTQLIYIIIVFLLTGGVVFESKAHSFLLETLKLSPIHNGNSKSRRESLSPQMYATQNYKLLDVTNQNALTALVLTLFLPLTI